MFGSFLALLPLMIAAVSILSSYLVVLLLTEFMKVQAVVQYMVGLIGLGVAIDYSLLLVTRWREEVAHGADNETAVHRAMATAGRAVLVSGLTVALGLLSLIVVPIQFMRSIGIGGMLIPVVSVAVTLTLLPIALTGFGRRLDWPHLRHEDKPSRAWTAWARWVVRRRWVAAGLALVVLVTLAVTALGIHEGDPTTDSLAKSGDARAGPRGPARGRHPQRRAQSLRGPDPAERRPDHDPDTRQRPLRGGTGDHPAARYREDPDHPLAAHRRPPQRRVRHQPGPARRQAHPHRPRARRPRHPRGLHRPGQHRQHPQDVRPVPRSSWRSSPS